MDLEHILLSFVNLAENDSQYFVILARVKGKNDIPPGLFDT